MKGVHGAVRKAIPYVHGYWRVVRIRARPGALSPGAVHRRGLTMRMVHFDAVPVLAGEQRGLVTRRQLDAAGVGPQTIGSLVTRGQLRRVRRGVYLLAGQPWTYPTAALAAVLACSPQTVASHRCAAGLHGLVPVSLSGAGPAPPLEVTRPWGLRGGSDGLIVHRSRYLPTFHLGSVNGVPVTIMARTIADLAPLVGDRQLARWAAQALRERRLSLGSLASVAGTLSRGRPGRRRLWSVLDELASEDRAPGLSELEVQARRVLAAAQLRPDRWEQNVAPAGSGWIGRVDALFAKALVVAEFDGDRFHDRRSDARRDGAMLDAGYLVLRFSWFDVTRRAELVVAELRAVLAGRRSLAA